jgi:hypothetical protein
MHHELADLPISVPSTTFDFGSADQDAAKAGSRIASPLAGLLTKVFTSIANWTGAEPGREWELIAGSISDYIQGHVSSPLQHSALSCAKEATEGFGAAKEAGLEGLAYGWAAVECAVGWFTD